MGRRFEFLPGILVVLALCLQAQSRAQTPIVSTVAGLTPPAGAPVRGYGGDGASAINAALALANLQNECDPLRFEQTSHIFVDSAGSLYLADSNNQRIRRITPGGVVSTVAGSGERPQTNARCEPTGPIGDGGQALSARLYNASDAVLDAGGNLIVADQQNNRIRQVSPSGSITTIAGNGTHNIYAPGIPATASPMDWPSGLAIDASNLIYFAELHGNRVARITSAGLLATVAGTGFPGFNGDRIPATTAQLKKPAGIAVDAAGNIYIADTGNHRIRKVTAKDGLIQTLAGTGNPGYSGDGGPATAASLDTPMDVKVDSRGNVYIADTANHRVRRIDTQGIITTVAGTGAPDRGPDLVDARTSALNFPSAIAIDPNNDVYVVDWQNFLVRKISFLSTPALPQGGIVSAASFALAPAPVAPGSIIAIFGDNLAPSALAASTVPLPTQLLGTSVEINGIPIPLFFVSAGQITGQLPFSVVTGAATAVVKSVSGASNVISVNVSATAPGLFQFAGSTRAAALNQDGITVNSPSTPEARGNVIAVFLTGQGQVTTSPIDLLQRPVAVASATIGGQPAQVAFAGLTPGTIGLAQVNLRIPENLAAGSAVPVVVQIGDLTSNAATISIR